MDLTEHRNTESEQARIANLMAAVPANICDALDIGARDGYIAKRLAANIPRVDALDLTCPQIDHDRVRCLVGDVTDLQLPSSAYDLVLCAEVLEHIMPQQLPTACAELARVAKQFILVGVPYKQDIRVGRTTCANCGGKNPPWGHVNRFDEKRIRRLFPSCDVVKFSYVGSNNDKTNWLSTKLMDWAGNPYGTYYQDEPCIHCSSPVGQPAPRNLLQKAQTKLAYWGIGLQGLFSRPQPNWIHVLIKKRSLS